MTKRRTNAPLSFSAEQRRAAAPTGLAGRPSRLYDGHIISPVRLSASSRPPTNICSDVRWRVL